MKMSLKLRIKKALTENIGIKGLAVGLAIAMWLIVVNIDNPTQSKTFTVPVTVTNEEVLTEAGRYYTIPDGNNTVRVRVTARRSIIEKLDSADFAATADLTYLENDSRVPVTVVYTGTYSNVTISTKKLYLEVSVGDDMVVKKDVTIETQGNLEEGCVISTVTSDPSSITMTGPEDILSQIEQVIACVDVTGANQDITAENVTIHFLDASGNEMDRSRITVDADTTNISVHIVRVKQVDINVSTSGTLADGLNLESVTVNPEKINIMGTADILNNISAINIPDSVVNLDNIKSSTTTTVDLNLYLPEGVTVASGENAQAEIVIEISENDTEEFEISTDNIAIRNLADGLEASFAAKKVTVEITGSNAHLDDLDVDNITGYVDASGLGAGTQKLQLTLELDDAYEVGKVTVEIVITDTSEEEE